MIKLNLKPLSVNVAWQGKRFKTNAYKRYENDLLTILPKIPIPDGNLYLNIQFGFSNSASDIDNPLKPFIDCLQKRYGFDDKRVTELNVRKIKVKKGHEFIKFDIASDVDPDFAESTKEVE